MEAAMTADEDPEGTGRSAAVDAVTIRQGGVRELTANTVKIRQGGVVRAHADRIAITQGGRTGLSLSHVECWPHDSSREVDARPMQLRRFHGSFG
jgi:hypothetical protein